MVQRVGVDCFLDVCDVPAALVLLAAVDDEHVDIDGDSKYQLVADSLLGEVVVTLGQLDVLRVHHSCRVLLQLSPDSLDLERRKSFHLPFVSVRLLFDLEGRRVNCDFKVDQHILDERVIPLARHCCF